MGLFPERSGCTVHDTSIVTIEVEINNFWSLWYSIFSWHNVMITRDNGMSTSRQQGLIQQDMQTVTITERRRSSA